MEELYDKIEQYLQQKMSAEDRQAFEAEMERDPALKEEVQAHLIARDALEVAIEDNLRKELEQLREGNLSDSEEDNNIRTLPGRRNLTRVLSIAASVLLIVGVFSFFYLQNTYSTEAIASGYYTPDEITLRSTSADVYPMAEGLQLLEAGNLEGAEAYFASIPENDEYYQDAQFYLAVVKMQMDQLEEARNLLQPLAQLSDPILSEKAEWQLLLSYVQEGNLEDPEFKSLMDKISNSSDHSYNRQAKELQAKLDSFWSGLFN